MIRLANNLIVIFSVSSYDVSDNIVKLYLQYQYLCAVKIEEREMDDC